MVTFDEFLTQYADDINEIYIDAEMSRNAKIAVVSTMRRYLGDGRYDPVSLLNLFRTTCYSAMQMGSVSKDGSIQHRVRSEGPNYLVGSDDFLPPETDLVDEQERGARLR